MEKKKILYIHHSASLGGAPKSLLFLIKKLDKNKYIPYLLIVKDGEVADMFRAEGVNVVVDERIKTFNATTAISNNFLFYFLYSLTQIIPTFLSTLRVVKKINPDIVHLNSSTLCFSAAAVKWYSKKIRTIVHVREIVLSNFYGKLLIFFNNIYTDAYIGIYKRSLLDFDKNRIKEIAYNWYEDIKIDGQDNKLNFGLPKNKVVFLYLARFTRTNGVLELAKNIKKIASKNDCPFFLLVGYVPNGKSRAIMTFIRKIFNVKKCQDQVKEILNDISNVRILNFDKNIQKYLGVADAVVCPFTKPHFSRTIVEAAVLGIPSLASNIDGQNEMVHPGVTGLMYDLYDYNDFEKKVNLLCDENIRKKLGSNGREFSLQKFSPNLNAKKIFNLYEKMLEHN
jgi:glycosyltransferase involved in cell wall biosynthesis